MAGVGGGGVPAGGVSGEEDPIPFPVNSRSNNGGCGRTVARFELKMAPRHVIPDQCKEDILKNAFKNFEDSQSKEDKKKRAGSRNFALIFFRYKKSSQHFLISHTDFSWNFLQGEQLLVHFVDFLRGTFYLFCVHCSSSLTSLSQFYRLKS